MPRRLRVMIGLIAAMAVGVGGASLVAGLRTEAAAWISEPATVWADPNLSTPPSGETTTPDNSGAPKLVAPADPNRITLRTARLFGWALIDMKTGVMTGSANGATVTNTIESMIKPWFAADHLRRLADTGQQPTPQTLKELTSMIVDSNDPMAEKYYRTGGGDAVFTRLISICGLTRVKIVATQWSFTEMTPQDAVRYGQCLADGRGAGPQWTRWLLDVMKNVRGGVTDQISGEVQGGRWGIVDGLPPALAQDTSIKNGWTLYKDGWHVNCLAIHPDWSLIVMLRIAGSLQACAEACKSVAAALVVDP